MTDEPRAARIHYHMYESLEGIQEHAERIVELEELLTDWHEYLYGINGWKSSVMNACCELCKSSNGGRSPCASTSADLSESHCDVYAQEVIESRMRELGIEVDDASTT